MPVDVRVVLAPARAVNFPMKNAWSCGVTVARCWARQVKRLVDDRTYVMKQINMEGMTPREQMDAINEVRCSLAIIMLVVASPGRRPCASPGHAQQGMGGVGLEPRTFGLSLARAVPTCGQCLSLQRFRAPVFASVVCTLSRHGVYGRSLRVSPDRSA